MCPKGETFLGVRELFIRLDITIKTHESTWAKMARDIKKKKKKKKNKTKNIVKMQKLLVRHLYTLITLNATHFKCLQNNRWNLQLRSELCLLSRTCTSIHLINRGTDQCF